MKHEHESKITAIKMKSKLDKYKRFFKNAEELSVGMKAESLVRISYTSRRLLHFHLRYLGSHMYTHTHTHANK